MKWLHPWFQLMRISNLPTCITNVMTGCGLGILSLPSEDPGPWIEPVRFSFVLGGVCAFYLSGMILNDVMDADRDAVDTPNRPIPSGRINRRTASIVGCILLLAGWIGCTLAGGWPGGIAATGLLVSILLYQQLHAATVPALVLMGLCRALVYVVAAFAITTTPDPVLLIPLCIGIGLFTTGVTGIARGEDHGGRAGAWTTVLIGLGAMGPACALAIAYPMDWSFIPWMAFLITAVMLGIRIRCSLNLLALDPPRVRSSVMGLLAGIALLDAFFLAMIGWVVLALLAVACFAMVSLLQQSISGT
ncbi:MAG TPA: hypothetical protein DEO57_02210 [Phycisphaerales bacterium]|nr:hypothetical protein [Phycisphaerales bacterium]